MTLSSYRFHTRALLSMLNFRTHLNGEFKNYVNKAMLNYEYGYTFATGMALDKVDAAVLSGNTNPVPLVWPMPEE